MFAVKRSTSTNFLLNKKRLTERAAAAEAQTAAQEEIEQLKVSLAKAKQKHQSELSSLRAENDSLKKWTEGLLAELKRAQAEQEEQAERGEMRNWADDGELYE